MGPSICRSIIETHEGRLWAVAARPKGAVFCFHVACAPGESVVIALPMLRSLRQPRLSQALYVSCDVLRRTLTVADDRESGAIQVALEIADSAMTYSYRYQNAFQAAPAIDLLLLDASNPQWRRQRDAVETILHDLDLEDAPRLTIFNKSDRAVPEALGEPVPYVSARTCDGIPALRADIAARLLPSDAAAPST